jgi:predicted kinase
MATLHLLIGPVGAGKTTYAERRIQGTSAVSFDLDSWMVRLFGDDPRPLENVLGWYLERRERCRGLLWQVSLDVLRAGLDVYLELGLITAADREAFYQRARAESLSLRVLLLDAARDVRRERVLQRNQSPRAFTQLVPPEFFERASDAWEPPTEVECAAWGIVHV